MPRWLNSLEFNQTPEIGEKPLRPCFCGLFNVREYSTKKKEKQEEQRNKNMIKIGKVVSQCSSPVLLL